MTTRARKARAIAEEGSPDDMLRPAEIARMLGKHPSQVSRMMASGDLPAVGEPGKRLVKRRDVIAVIERGSSSDKMTDEQRRKLRKLGKAVETAVDSRDAYIRELHAAGIFPTEMARCIPGGTPDGTMHPTQVHRIIKGIRQYKADDEAEGVKT